MKDEWEKAVENGWKDKRLEHWFSAQGVNINRLSAFGFNPGINIIGLMSVEADPDGYYQPHPDGKPAIIMPTCLNENMEPEDLIAWRSDSPATVWRRSGNADVLDPWSVFRTTIPSLEESLTIHETPLDWLISGCNGCVILDWSERLFLTFTGVHRIIADLPFRSIERLEFLMSPKAFKTASISVPEQRMEDAA